MERVPFEMTKDSTAIEILFCEEFKKLKQQPLSVDGMSLLISLCLNKDSAVVIPEKEKPFLIKLIESRIKNCFTFTYKDIRFILFIAYLTESPGKAVMFLWYIQYWAFKNNKREITLELLCSEIIPNGFYSDEDLNKLWGSQKVITPNDGGFDSDNLLDYSDAGMSIQFK
jgi:hypothetical protein